MTDNHWIKANQELASRGYNMFIDVNIDIGNGYFEGKKIEISDEDLVKMIDRYFEIKGIKIQEIGII